MFDASISTKTWTNEKIALMCELHAKGYSFSHIAAAVGMTRNACIGRANRMGLKSAAVTAPPIRRNPKREPVKFGWTDEAIEAVRDMVSRGMTDRQIANAICLRYPDKPAITYGSISVLRLKHGIQSLNIPDRPKKVVPLPSQVEAYFTATAKSRRSVALIDLEPGMCRWPLGDSDIRFCGADAIHGRSYCKGHFIVSCDQSWLKTKNGAALRREIVNV